MKLHLTEDELKSLREKIKKAAEKKPKNERYGNNDANGWRSGPAEDDYMSRYDSPDNKRDSMG